MRTDIAVGGDFCTLLRECRERRRLSQLDLATLAGTTQRHLSFVEQGRSRPGRALVARLAESWRHTSSTISAEASQRTPIRAGLCCWTNCWVT